MAGIRRAFRGARHRRGWLFAALVVIAATVFGLTPAWAAWTGTDTNASSFTANGTFPTMYHQAIVGHSPFIYHEMDDASGNSATDSSGNSRTGTYSASTGPATFESTAAVAGNVGNGTSDAGAVFTGNHSTSSCAWAGSDPIYSAPTTYTIEFWFKTNDSSGGMLVDFGNPKFKVSPASSVDRFVYIDSSNHLRFGVQPSSGVIDEVVSDSTVNTNTWYLVDAVQSTSSGSGISAGLSLYINGTKQASTNSTTTSSGNSGYWKIGCDSLANMGSNAPASYGFDGAMDDVAIWSSTALTSTKISNHWAAVGASYASTITGDSPTLYWRLDDSSPTGEIADASPNGNTGHYYDFGGSATYSAGAGATGDSDNAATLSGNASSNNKQCGYLTTTGQFSPGSVYTIEFWFKTSSTTGGPLVDFADNKFDGSQPLNVDRFVYLNSSNKVEFGVASSRTTNIASSTALNDNAWHLVDAVESGTSMHLYIDGTLAASITLTATPTTSASFWRVGCDDLTQMDQPPSSYGFNGSIDDVAIYQGTALTATQVSNHHAAVGASYSTTIKADAPTIYYRLDEAAPPSTVTDSSGNGNAGSWAGIVNFGSVTYGVAGALVNAQSTSKAVTYNDAFGVNPALETNPQTFTIEVWIKTTTTVGGVIVGFAYQTVAVPDQHFDRMLWMDNNGKLNFGVYPGSLQVISSSSAYNDGNWHMVAVTLGASGLFMYVDGSQVASNASVTGAENYDGYWRWGYGVLNLFSPAPASLFFNGSLDEFSVTPSQLSAATISSDYSANY